METYREHPYTKVCERSGQKKERINEKRWIIYALGNS
jgi:hypothetical protein